MKNGLTHYQNASHGLDNPKKAFMLLLKHKAKVQMGIEAM